MLMLMSIKIIANHETIILIGHPFNISIAFHPGIFTSEYMNMNTSIISRMLKKPVVKTLN